MRFEGFVEKAWGHENIWCTNDKYCGKLLKFNTDSQFSMHFHKEKDETWYVQDGIFEVEWINTKTAEININKLVSGDTWHNPPLLPHRLVCLEEGTIIEVSTADSVEDNYRIMPGDSQTENKR